LSSVNQFSFLATRANFAAKYKKPTHVAGEWVSEKLKNYSISALKDHSPDVPNMRHKQHELFWHIGIWRRVNIAKKQS
jgi:hypothetical protein